MLLVACGSPSVTPDGVLALRALGGDIGAPVTALGYSQGGGVVLSAQALEHVLTGARTLRGVVAIAPEWPTRVGAFGYERLLRDPEQFTGATGLAPPTVTALRQYGWFANRLGAAHAADSFPAAERAQIADRIESRCTVALGGALGANQLRVRDLVDDVVTADPAGARVLIATHDTVLERKIEHAAAWAEAAATGVATPTCASSFLPVCVP